MANLSNVSICLNGSEENIQQAYNEILKVQEDDNLFPSLISDQDGYNAIFDIEISLEENELTLYGYGRWNGPYEYIKHIVVKHNLSGNYFDMESGCDFSHLIEFYNGSISHEEVDSFFSDLSIKVQGIEYWIENESYRADEEDWEENNDYVINLFESHGVSVQQLKEVWLSY